MAKDKEIYIAGYPSFHGGADTELFHQVVLLRRMGVRVVLVPMHSSDPAMAARMTHMGCFTREYKPDIFKDRIVVSFCNGGFLQALPEINKVGKPKAVVWANCMTWTFPHEVEAHEKGWITHHLFQTDYQRQWLLQALTKKGPVHEMPYQPYYDVEGDALGISHGPRPKDYFGIGRISRDDAAKYAPDMWRQFDRVATPGSKKVFVLGFGPNARGRCGEPPPTTDYLYWGPGGCPSYEFYPRVHAIMHSTGGSRENLPRIMMECWHSGSVLICEDDYGFREHVTNGENGFRCSSPDEMVYRASQLAFDPALRSSMVSRGLLYLRETFGDWELCSKGWLKMFGEVE